LTEFESLEDQKLPGAPFERPIRHKDRKKLQQALPVGFLPLYAHGYQSHGYVVSYSLAQWRQWFRPFVWPQAPYQVAAEVFGHLN
jgi:hypothetical protein